MLDLVGNPENWFSCEAAHLFPNGICTFNCIEQNCCWLILVVFNLVITVSDTSDSNWLLNPSVDLLDFKELIDLISG